VATTAAAYPDFRRSHRGRIRNASSHSTLRTRIPSTCAALSTELCVCSEHTTTSRPVASRAAVNAVSVEVGRRVLDVTVPPVREAEQLRHPVEHQGPRARSRRGRSANRIAVELSVAASSSARIAGSDELVAK